jgi:hypothetical protein
MVLRVLDLVCGAGLQRSSLRGSEPGGGGRQQSVRRLMKVDVGLVLLVLVQVDGAGRDDGRQAERDRDDDLEPPSPDPGGTAGGDLARGWLSRQGSLGDPGLLPGAADSSATDRHSALGVVLA